MARLAEVQLRRLILFGLLAALALPAVAAKRITVAQLEQSLASGAAAHRADIELARQLNELELTERLTEAALNRFAASLHLEPHTALALALLSDQSAFLDPPAAELPATAPPDSATQQRLLDAARGYVAQTVPHLPDFFATRTTNRFDDSPQALAQGNWPVRAGLHMVGTTSRQITFRDGKEIQDTQLDTTAQKAQQEVGLHTWGEFGPELSVVLTDAAKGTTTFSHWEQTRAGLAAVYRYSVPRAASHYAVSYCCVSESSVVPLRQSGGRRNQSAPTPPQAAATAKPFTETPAYHGSLSIDPATGAILRITLEAELSNGDPLLRAATVVEYGHVMIGDRSYICPVRSLAFSMEEFKRTVGNKSSTVGSSQAVDQAWGAATSHSSNAPVLLVNETSFSQYHRLLATSRILTGVTEPEMPSAAAGTSPAVAKAAPAAVEAGQSAEPSAPPPSTGTPASAPVAPQPPAPPVIPEISLTAADGVPDQPAIPAPPRENGYSVKLTSRLVDVGIVAYDKKNHPVTDLKLEDFEVYDNGRKQQVRFFSQFASEAAPPTAPTPEHAYSNRAPEAGSPAAAAPETGATVLLMDESHIAWGDLTHAKQEILKFLGTVAPGERVGLYTITRTGFKVLMEITTDHAALIARLQKWMPTAQSVSQAQDEEMRNRQQFNEVHSVTDLNSVNGNQVDIPDSASTVDPLLRSEGSNPARASLIILEGVARHLTAVAGHKNLVWVSTDNVFADWQNQAVGIDKSPKSLDSFALRAQEAMNEAHVAVFPMDVSQLESAAINADVRTRNVELNQAAMDTATLAGGTVGRNMAPGRITAEMQQDMHPIQGPIRQVADSTGGRVIRRAGDLASELAAVVLDGHATYLLSFSPQGEADGQYHNIAVKLTSRRNLTLRYRNGFLFQKEPGTLKERFQQAVWRPREASEISVTADVAAMNPGANVKIAIAAADLGMEEQAGRWMDKLDIFFIQRDDAGQHALVDGQTLGLRLKSSTYQSLLPAGVPFEHFVQLKTGMGSLRILVVDENSGRMGSVTIPAAALGAKP